jgi:S1-C subfamily serine protease
MDIEELSKSQIVLLVLLISFVTSMATGIVTVSLMNQAPTSVAQTVNRVIQQTIKEVSAPQEAAAVAVSTPAKTVVLKESDEIAAAVQSSSPSIVRLYSEDGTTFLGLGAVLDVYGTIVTDAAAIGSASAASIIRADGTSVSGTVSTRDSTNGIALLSIATSTTATSTPAWTPITLSALPQLGETVVLIAGESNTSVEDGIISSLVPAQSGTPTLVKTNISGDNVLYGSPLIDTNGDLVGLSTSASRALSGSSYLPVAAIEADMKAK